MRSLRGLAWGAYVGLLAGTGIAFVVVVLATIDKVFETDPLLSGAFYVTLVCACIGLIVGAFVGAVSGGVLGFLYAVVRLDQHASWIAGPGLALAVVWFGLANETLITRDWFAVAVTVAAAVVLASVGWFSGRFFARKMSEVAGNRSSSEDKNVPKAVTV